MKSQSGVTSSRPFSLTQMESIENGAPFSYGWSGGFVYQEPMLCAHIPKTCSSVHGPVKRLILGYNKLTLVSLIICLSRDVNAMAMHDENPRMLSKAICCPGTSDASWTWLLRSPGILNPGAWPK